MRDVEILVSLMLRIHAGVFSVMLAQFSRVFNVDDDETFWCITPLQSDTPCMYSLARLAVHVYMYFGMNYNDCLDIQFDKFNFCMSF